MTSNVFSSPSCLNKVRSSCLCDNGWVYDRTEGPELKLNQTASNIRCFIWLDTEAHYGSGLFEVRTHAAHFQTRLKIHGPSGPAQLEGEKYLMSGPCREDCDPSWQPRIRPHRWTSGWGGSEVQEGGGSGIRIPAQAASIGLWARGSGPDQQRLTLSPPVCRVSRSERTGSSPALPNMDTPPSSSSAQSGGRLFLTQWAGPAPTPRLRRTDVRKELFSPPAETTTTMSWTRDPVRSRTEPEPRSKIWGISGTVQGLNAELDVDTMEVMFRLLLLFCHFLGCCDGMPHVLRFGESTLLFPLRFKNFLLIQSVGVWGCGVFAGGCSSAPAAKMTKTESSFDSSEWQSCRTWDLLLYQILESVCVCVRVWACVCVFYFEILGVMISGLIPSIIFIFWPISLLTSKSTIWF